MPGPAAQRPGSAAGRPGDHDQRRRVSDRPIELGGAGVTDFQLAVLLRQTQWALDEAAHDVGAGRATPQGRAELAGSLEALAAILRASAPDPHATGHLSAPRAPHTDDERPGLW